MTCNICHTEHPMPHVESRCPACGQPSFFGGARGKAENGTHIHLGNSYGCQNGHRWDSPDSKEPGPDANVVFPRQSNER